MFRRGVNVPLKMARGIGRAIRLRPMVFSAIAGAVLVLNVLLPVLGENDAGSAVAGFLLLNPMIAAAAMALSSLAVVANANRLRRYTPPTLAAGDGA